MTIFKYIEDKDVFQRFYSRMLAKRLVHTASASDDAETSMISKLKEACGFEYTNRLQRMFQDMQISKDLNSQYREYLDGVQDKDDVVDVVDTTYHVLGTGFWPLSPPSTPFIPPDVIVKTYELFQKFYFDKHNGRKLTWLWSLCKGEIRANYIKGSKVPFTFQVSTYQIAILLLFNHSDVITFEDIQKSTALQRDILDPSLTIMLKAKVLLTQPEGGSVAEPGTTFVLNYNFKNKKVRVNLNVPVKSEAKQEVDDTHKTIEEDRKMLMQVRHSHLPSGVFLIYSYLSLSLSFSKHGLIASSPVGHRSDHEVAEEDEARSARTGDDPADQGTLRPANTGHQEMHRHLARQGIPGAVRGG